MENRDSTRDSKGRFIKGSAGNPKGRPKKQQEMPTPQEVLDSATMEAVLRLIELTHSDDEAIALQACMDLLNRTIGNPNTLMGFGVLPKDIQKNIKSISWQW